MIYFFHIWIPTFDSIILINFFCMRRFYVYFFFISKWNFWNYLIRKYIYGWIQTRCFTHSTRSHKPLIQSIVNILPYTLANHHHYTTQFEWNIYIQPSQKFDWTPPQHTHSIARHISILSYIWMTHRHTHQHLTHPIHKTNYLFLQKYGTHFELGLIVLTDIQFMY